MSVKNNPLPPIKPLTTSEQIEAEMVIGLVPFSEIQTTTAVDLPSRESLLKGTSLSVSKPGGEPFDDPAITQHIANELERLLGGWFVADLTPSIQLYHSLVSPELQEYYRQGGMTITWDEPAEAFYYLDFAVPPWQIQVVGEPGIFHVIFLGQPLTETDAIGGGGHPLIRPLGDVMPLLAEAVPAITQSLADESESHPQNVFDTYLAGEGVIVRAGVRLRLSDVGAVYPGEQNYFYGIRINLDLRQ